MARQGRPLQKTPNYIERLRSQRENTKAARQGRENQKQAHASSDGSSPFEHLSLNDVPDTPSNHGFQPIPQAKMGNAQGLPLSSDQYHVQSGTMQPGDMLQDHTLTDSTAFWFDAADHGQAMGDNMDMNMDFTFADGDNPESLDGIDWSQWDTLLGGKAF